MNCDGRELLEEGPGYLAGRLKPIGSYFSPGIITEKMYAYAAYNLEKSTAALEDGEEIDAFMTKWPEALEMIKLGQIIDSKTIATLLLYDKFFSGQVAAPPGLMNRIAHGFGRTARIAGIKAANRQSAIHSPSPARYRCSLFLACACGHMRR